MGSSRLVRSARPRTQPDAQVQGMQPFPQWPSRADLRDGSSRMIHDAMDCSPSCLAPESEDGLLELALDGPPGVEGAGDERVQAGATKLERLLEVLILPPRNEPIFIEMMAERPGLSSMRDQIAERL